MIINNDPSLVFDNNESDLKLLDKLEEILTELGEKK